MHVELKTSMMEQITLGSQGFYCCLNIYKLILFLNLVTFFFFFFLNWYLNIVIEPFLFHLKFRTACVIAVSKARDTFEPFLHQVNPLPFKYCLNFFFHFYIIHFIYLVDLIISLVRTIRRSFIMICFILKWLLLFLFHFPR